jgi:hypothetical protein
VPVITTDAQGRVSGVTTANIASNTYTGGTGITVAGNVINSVWTQLGNNIYNNNIANVGIGTAAPAYPLNVVGNNAVATGLVQNANAAGIGFAAQNTAATGAGNGIGLYGYTRQGAGFGVYGFNVDTTGTGVVGIGNNVPNYSLLNAGSGGAFFGNVVGLYAFTSGSGGFGLLGRSTDTANAFGVGGIANGVAFAAASAGGAFSGLNYAVSAIQTNTSTTTQEAAGYFGSRGPTGSATLVEAYSNTDIHYKIWQSVVGAVATCIPDLAGNAVTLHAAETPEFYFQDYGQAQLVNGRTHVTIDPILAKNVTINERHPLRVFVQLEGDCNGVYVTNKTASGFDVVELNGGTSNVGFQWTITCNVADAQIGNHLSRFSDLRFEPGPINEAKEISPARENAPQPAVKYFNK